MPDPDGPITAVKVPGGRARLTPSSAVTELPADPYIFRTETNRSASSVVAEFAFPCLAIVRPP
ncbi:hypothetical protein GCM10009780_68460 [Actinomadura alba]